MNIDRTGLGRPRPFLGSLKRLRAFPDALRGLSRGLSVCLLLLAAAGTAAAQERTHQITWGHANPGRVSRFVVLISPIEGDVAATREIDVGLPTAQRVGSMSIFSAVVSFADDEFLAVAAIGHDGRVSTASNWSGMPPSRPGQPVLVKP